VNQLRLVHNEIEWFHANKKMSAVDINEYRVHFQEKDPQGFQIPDPGTTDLKFEIFRF
jgi:hypothetical protein